MVKKPTEKVLGNFEVESIEKIKSGQGKKGPWKLWEIEFDDGETARGFDKVEEGDTVEVFEETTYDEDGDPEYTNTKYRTLKKAKKAKKAAASDDDDDDEPKKSKQTSSTGGSGSDKRVLKLLAIIAVEVGVDEEVINGIIEEK